MLRLMCVCVCQNVYECVLVRETEISEAWLLQYPVYLHVYLYNTCIYLRATREIGFSLIVLPSWNKVFIIINNLARGLIWALA